MKKNRFTFKNLIIVIFLLSLWVGLTVSYIFNYNLSISVISYLHPLGAIENPAGQRVFSGEKIVGEFEAEDNYLGILSISFSTFEEVSYNEEDILVFRIKEKGAKEWYYENNYRSGPFYDIPFFPFGFPVISDSKGKTYYFELESLRGNSLNAVAVSRWGPGIASRYQMPRERLEENGGYLFSFLSRKIMASLSSRDVLSYSIVYFLPLLFYITYLYPSKLSSKLDEFIKKISHKGNSLYGLVLNSARAFLNYIFVFASLMVVIFDLFLVNSSNDIAFFVVGSLWFAVLLVNKITYRFSFMIGLFFLTLSFIFLYSGFVFISEKAAVWAYMFFVVGVIQAILYINKKNFTLNDK